MVAVARKRILLIVFTVMTAFGLVQGTHALSTSPEHVSAPLGANLAAIQTTMRLPAATSLNDQDGDKVFDSLEERFLAEPGRELSVIVTFRHDVAFDEAMRAAQAAAGPYEVRYAYPNLGGFNAPLTLGKATRVAALDEVRQVEWDQPGHAELDTATVGFGVRTVQDELNITGDGDGNARSFTGTDIGVAILDTGFHGDHVDLKGKFTLFLDAEDGQAKDPYDSGDHGTHVASIAGGLGKGDPAMTGVAPGASFVGFKIAGGQAYGGESGSKAGALWAYDKVLELQGEHNIRVTTISFGFGITVDGTDALELAVDKLWAAGVVSFKSTGNSGSERGTVTIPGGARGIIGVASMLGPGPSESMGTPGYVKPGVPETSPDYGFHLSGYSSRGPTEDGRIKPDIAAPGQSIMAADAATTDGYTVKSGTSMASPFAAGAAALVLDADPSLTPDQLRHILFDTAHDWGAPGPDVDYGHGRLDALRAVQKALVDRLAREAAPYEAVAAVASVAGPDIPYHAAGTLSGRTPTSDGFMVEDVGTPLALTIIHNETIALPGPAGDVSGPARVVVVELRGPDDMAIGRVSVSPTSRQQTMAFVPDAAGEHTLTMVNVVDDIDVVWDVSAGLPPPDDLLPGLTIPNQTEYAESLGSARSGGDAAEVPGPGLAVVAAAAVAPLCIRRRR